MGRQKRSLVTWPEAFGRHWVLLISLLACFAIPLICLHLPHETFATFGDIGTNRKA